ncbi:TnpV protein [Faecalicoccus acidiformans]|uniref:TnpV protein n=1 Tax=Faecalicoccus acidiformans TaxID=915173 RepID=UPI003D18A0B7
MSYLTSRKRTAYQFVGTAALVISERIPQSHLHKPAHKQQADVYLADTQERMERLTEPMKRAQGVTEQLKAENVLEWVQRMNNIWLFAKEIMEKEIIFA